MSLNAPATREEIAALYKSPILDLVYRAATVHREHHDPRQVQVCTLLSIKTGGCPEIAAIARNRPTSIRPSNAKTCCR